MHDKRQYVFTDHSQAMGHKKPAKLENERSDASVLLRGRYLSVVGLEHLVRCEKNRDVA